MDPLSTARRASASLSCEANTTFNPLSRPTQARNACTGLPLMSNSGAASYGVYYWAMSKDGFNSKPHGGKPSKWPPRHNWHGHGHRNGG